ncbi:MAG: carbohydrate porin [Hyphomicrobium sp.]
MTLTLEHEAETWSSGFGGLQRGSIYNGLTTASLTLDLDKLVAWHDAKLFVSGFDIQGHGPSTSLVGNLQLISNIEATPDVKLYDLWFEQELLNRTLSIRFGQEGANDEMMITKYGALFLNSSFGFPGLPAADLPSGGPNYPMAAPFVRVRYTSDKISFTGALFTDDPAPPGTGDPQLRDRGGTAFRLDDHGLSFAELAYETEIAGLPGTYKLGAWYSSAKLLPKEHATIGDDTLLGGTGGAAFYGIIDQMLWQDAGAKDNGIGAFLMVMGTPTAICFSDLYVEGGFNWKGPIRGRSNDVLGLGVAYLHLDPGYRQFATNALSAAGEIPNVKSNETVIEATYLYEVAPWWILQPDIQLVINPFAGLPSPVNDRSLSNALATGLRMTVKF